MEDSSNSKKPLRPSFNKHKDLSDTYLKNQAERHLNLNNFEAEQGFTPDDTEEPEIETIEGMPFEEEVQEQAVAEPVDSVKEIEKERDELKEQLLRVAAELENFRRRALKEKREMLDYANERLLFNLLPLLDDFGKASEAGKKATDCESLLQGIDLIYQKALKLFENEGVKMMENSVGKPFDVNQHEAVMKMPSELPENYIISEVQAGYTMHDKVLRHAKVVTSSGEPQDENDTEGSGK
jgi:molecular chaperone GrpE